MSGKVVKSKRGKSKLIQTSSKSGHGERVKPSLAQTVTASRSFALKDWFFVIALIAAVFLVYQPAWQGGFIWDDSAHVTRPELRSWYGLFRIWFDLGATQQYYPLLHSVFWVQSWLWGDATLGYHLVNILLHAMAAVMVALILRRLDIPGAFFAAAIFALHPVHVESVAWISELKNTLSAVFYLGSAMVYLRFDQQRRTSLYLWALGLFVLGLLSKTVTATLPSALLVIFWWQRGRLSWRKDVLPLLPFFLLGAVAGVFTAWVERTLIGAQGEAFAIPALERILIAGKAIWFYLGKLFWPANLIFIYPRWETSQAAAWQYLFPAAAFALVVTLWALRRRWRGPLAGLLFFVGTLFPVLGFFNVFPFIYSFVADHFQYLASLGIITLVAAGIAMLLKRMQLWRHPAGYAICVLLLLTLAVLTWRQSGMYTDISTLYQTTIDLNPKCWMCYNNRGLIYNDRSNYMQAIEDFNRAIEINPDNAQSYNNRGIAYGAIGNYKQAIEDLNRVIKINPGYADVYFNRGIAYTLLGNYKQAIEDYDRVIKINPDYANAYNKRGIIYLNQGNNISGCRDARKVCELGNCKLLEAANTRGLCR
jgi:tetratricopeptide (TPR) repeat protein